MLFYFCRGRSVSQGRQRMGSCCAHGALWNRGAKNGVSAGSAVRALRIAAAHKFAGSREGREIYSIPSKASLSLLEALAALGLGRLRPAFGVQDLSRDPGNGRFGGGHGCVE